MSELTDKLTRSLKVKEKIFETKNAVSLIFDIPDSLKKDFQYSPGQFVTLFLNVGGEEIRRSYSLASSPLLKDPFQITIKRVDGGRGSNFIIDKIQVGDILKLTPPSGHFFKEDSFSSPKHYVLFAGGSGITPIFSILKSALTQSTKNKVTLLYANRSEEEIIYLGQLKDLAKSFEQFRIFHALSAPIENWCDIRGRCTPDVLMPVLERHLGQDSLPKQYFICGPSGFMKTIRETLEKSKVATENIFEESFGDSISQTPAPSGDFHEIRIGEPPPLTEEPQELECLLNGQDLKVSMNKDQTILEALIEAGENPPYSCMDGACMACLAKLIQGRVYQKDAGILTEENIENREILTCQARPLSRQVKVDYDNL